MTQAGWTIGFDADDTLWHNERSFQITQARFADLLAEYAEPDNLAARLLAAERRNLRIYGFGVKGFVLSMIETALDVTENRVPQSVIAEVMAAGRAMLAEPVEVFADAPDAVKAAKNAGRVILITKGDLLDQERKLAQSGLGELFDDVHVVSDKTASTYAHIFAAHDTAHQMMVGNSLKSDVIPALKAGLWGVHIPHELTWAYEAADPPVTHRKFRKLDKLSELPALIGALS